MYKLGHVQRFYLSHEKCNAYLLKVILGQLNRRELVGASFTKSMDQNF